MQKATENIDVVFTETKYYVNKKNSRKKITQTVQLNKVC